DPVADLAARYYQLGTTKRGAIAQLLMRLEVGGTPTQYPARYALRSPLSQVRALARTRAEIAIWWSSHDKVVTRQDSTQSYPLLERLKALRPRADVWQRYGRWPHAWPYVRYLGRVLGMFGLVPLHGLPPPPGWTGRVARGWDRKAGVPKLGLGG